MRVATFNVQNLRLRGDAAGPHFDGARDEITPLSKLSQEAQALDRADRALTARLIADADADIIALQEVFDQRTLDTFHDAHLSPLGANYPHRLCLPGNDGRRHVALMSRLPLENVQSHAALTFNDLGLSLPEGESAAAPIFVRDCLAASCGALRLYVVHFKAPASLENLAVTEAEAIAVRRIIERDFTDAANAHWLILGDFNVNDVPSGDVLEVLSKDFAIDLANALPPSERWTYYRAGAPYAARPDRILASLHTSPLCRNFTVRREGMMRAATDYSGPRLEGVGQIRPRASDHALVQVDLLAL